MMDPLQRAKTGVYIHWLSSDGIEAEDLPLAGKSAEVQASRESWSRVKIDYCLRGGGAQGGG